MATLIALLAAASLAALFFAIAYPYVAKGKIRSRVDAVTTERSKLREKNMLELEKSKLRHKGSKDYMKKIVEKLNLQKHLMAHDTMDKLKMAGYRSNANLIYYLFMRVVMPVVFFIATFALIGFLINPAPELHRRALFAFLGAGIGFFAPNMFLSNIISKRQADIKRAFSDALDLLLICVESGMAVEPALKKVGDEISFQSVPLAEELSLLTAELSYLRNRRDAYENFGKRTGLPIVKATMTSLIQAERYGTPVGHALRVMAQENRDARMMEAERKAAALPPKLTVPMILFFLPVIFVIVMTPAFMQIGDLMG